MSKTNALLLGAALALSATAAQAKEWWFLNAGAARCDNANTSPYPSPKAFTDSLIRTGRFQDQKVFRDPKTNSVRGVMVQTKDNIFLYYFTDESTCQLVLRESLERGFVNKPGELD